MFDVVSYGVTDDVAPARRQLTRQRRVESEEVSLWCCLTGNTRKNADHQSKVPFSSRPIMIFFNSCFSELCGPDITATDLIEYEELIGSMKYLK